MDRSFFRSFINTFREKVFFRQGKASRAGKNSSLKEGLTDYSVYRLSASEKLRYYMVCAAVSCVLGLVFYRSFAACAAVFVFSVPLKKTFEAYLAEKRKERLLSGFMDVLYTVSGAAAAGKQMPSALELAAGSLKRSRGEGSDIFREIDMICRRYRQTHADIGAFLTSFGRRSGLREIAQFASAYRTCQLCGGDLEEVCRKSAELLIDRISFAEETRMLISQKKIDVALLTAMPVAVLMLLNILNYSYVAVLYETAAGRVVMTLCLLLIVFALLWGIKITRIEL